MSLAPLSFSSQADVDMTEIWVYVARDSLTAADRLLAKFSATFRRLQRFPELGEQCKYRGIEYRRMSVGNYALLYQFAAGEIRIVRVFHASRQWEGLL